VKKPKAKYGSTHQRIRKNSADKNKKITVEIPSMPNIETEQGNSFPYVSSEQLSAFQTTFSLLGISNGTPYPGIDQFTRNMGRAGVLRYEGVQFTLSGSTTPTFKRV